MIDLDEELIRRHAKVLSDILEKAKLGSGGRFAALKAKLSQNPKIDNPAAVAASIGNKKYGKKKMHKWAAAGRKSGE